MENEFMQRTTGRAVSGETTVNTQSWPASCTLAFHLGYLLCFQPGGLPMANHELLAINIYVLVSHLGKKDKQHLADVGRVITAKPPQ